MNSVFRRVMWLVLMACAVWGAQAKEREFVLTSPDGRLVSHVRVADRLWFNLSHDGAPLLGWSDFDIESVGSPEKGFFYDHERVPRMTGSRRVSADRMVASPFTRQASMRDCYHALTLAFAGGWEVEFRAYDEGLAYRVRYLGRDTLRVNEHCYFRTLDDCEVWAPYVSSYQEGNRAVQYGTSFENLYTHTRLSQLNADRNCFLPLLIGCAEGKKVCFGESHLEGFPGLYLHAGTLDAGLLTGDHAPFPAKTEQGGHNNLQMLVRGAEEYQAVVAGPRELPWRIMMVSTDDAALATNNMTYLLAAPSRVEDVNWIKPGKVAWDWWNNWNIEGVDFRAGINNETYKYYIDFASKHGVEYVILDEGWAVNGQCDLFQVVPEINLPELVKYAAERRVGIILWAGYWAFDRDMERVCRHYAEMGVKGFKVDFMDRDDQPMTEFYYRAADMAARYRLLLDFHGAFKPAGLNRTYPNVLNFEGVAGLEQLKWAPASWDQVTYDCQLPFIRQTAGPMDYTQGAMNNAAKGHYHPSWSEPMSQGTRCHQLALYVVLESPLNMMCDSPTNYEREEECARLIAGLPTVWDETRVLQGRVGEYAVVARRKGDIWYVGGINNWEPRSITVDLSGFHCRQYDLYRDGANADRKGSDYKRLGGACTESVTVPMAAGGGFLMIMK